MDLMVTLVPAKQWHTCVPVATHLFSLPSLALAVCKYPNRIVSFIGHFLLPPTALLFLCLLPPDSDSILSRTKETVAVTEKEEGQLDGHGHGHEIVLHVCTSFSLRPHFFFVTVSSPFPVALHFHLLPVPLVLSVSLLTTANSGCRSFHFLHHIPLPLSVCLSAVSFFLFVSVCSHSPLCGQSPCSGLSVS